MTIPPGIVYCAQLVPKLGVPPFVAYLLLNSLHEHGFKQLDSHPWLRAILILFAAPFVFYCKELWITFDNRRQARKLGAKLFPTVRGKWYIPVGADLVWELITSLKHEYAGDTIGEVLSKDGKTVMFNTLGERRGALATRAADLDHRRLSI